MRFAIFALAALASLTSVAHADGDVAKGEKVFKKCAACHNVDKAENKVGPHLDGIIGRKTASIESYKYSEAMLAKGAEGFVWDEANLSAYLANPKTTVPGSKMAFPGLKKPEDIADLMAFLKTKPAL